MYTEMRVLITIWYAEDAHVTLKSDGIQFIATIEAGITGETLLSVGYSCPNLALTVDEESLVAPIAHAVQVQWEKTDKLPLEEMLPGLLKLCKAANQAYNDARWPL